MKDFRVETIAQTEFEEAAVWYENQRSGLGLEFIAEIDSVLVRIAHEGQLNLSTTSGPIDPLCELGWGRSIRSANSMQGRGTSYSRTFRS